MKHGLMYTLGLIVLSVVAFATTPAEAQITSPGPYYATPAWDQQLPASTRFIILSNWSSAAVLDRETGLVWEKSPSTVSMTWDVAQGHCNGMATGNRKGWRLPKIQELASLIDPSVGSPGPNLPIGHPFSNVQADRYWSATTTGYDNTQAWFVRFIDGVTPSIFKSSPHLVWCVRGGSGTDIQ
jgi:hypothetical protein